MRSTRSGPAGGGLGTRRKETDGRTDGQRKCSFPLRGGGQISPLLKGIWIFLKCVALSAVTGPEPDRLIKLCVQEFMRGTVLMFLQPSPQSLKVRNSRTNSVLFKHSASHIHFLSSPQLLLWDLRGSPAGKLKSFTRTNALHSTSQSHTEKREKEFSKPNVLPITSSSSASADQAAPSLLPN